MKMVFYKIILIKLRIRLKYIYKKLKIVITNNIKISFANYLYSNLCKAHLASWLPAACARWNQLLATSTSTGTLSPNS